MSTLKSLAGLVSLSLWIAPAMAAPVSTNVSACVNSTTGIVRIVASTSLCIAGETGMSWSLTGPTGPTGPMGPSGAMGPMGPIGANGATGPMGPIGPAGATGATGAAGPAGAAGANGAAGATGPQGPPVSFKGTWNAASHYLTGDAVALTGNSYIALQANTNINPLTDIAGAGLNWAVLAAQGGTGATGVPGAPGATGPAGPQGPAGSNATVPANLITLSNGLATNGYNGQNFNSSVQCMLGDIVLSVNAYGNGGAFRPADGTILSISSNAALFSILGTRFGGDGRSSFGLPDLRAFAPQGMQYSICVAGIFPSRN